MLDPHHWAVSTYGGVASNVQAKDDWLQGDGILLYAGQDSTGRPVPIGSARLDNLRDGFVDVELMYQIARKLQAQGSTEDLQELVSMVAAAMVYNQSDFESNLPAWESFRHGLLSNLTSTSR